MNLYKQAHTRTSQLEEKTMQSAGKKSIRAAVVFHGNGVYDGTECTEAVALLVGLSRMGAEVQVFAPDRDQAHVVDHLTGSEQEQSRNVLQESARLARGNAKPLSDLVADEWDILIVPGGFGAAKNLCNFGFKGPEMEVQTDIEQIMRQFRQADKYIGLTCIAPIIAAKVFGSEGAELTLGARGDDFPYAGSIDAASSFGAKMSEMRADGVCVDEKNKLISTPAYMQGNAAPHEVFDGI